MSCAAGNLDIVKFLFKRIILPKPVFMDKQTTIVDATVYPCPVQQAIMYGHEKVLAYLTRNGVKMVYRHSDAFVAIGRNANLAMIRQVLGDQTPFVWGEFVPGRHTRVRREILQHILTGASMSGRENIIRLIQSEHKAIAPNESFRCFSSQRIVNLAFGSGNLEVFLNLVGHADPLVDFTMEEFIANRGDLSLLQWLYDACGSSIKPQWIQLAVKGGYLDMVKWLLERTTPPEDLMSVALVLGDLPMIRYLHEDIGLPLVFGLYSLNQPMPLATFEYVVSKNQQPMSHLPIGLNEQPDRRWIDVIGRSGVPKNDVYVKFMVINNTLQELVEMVESGEIGIPSLTTDYVRLVAAKHGRLAHLEWILSKQRVDNRHLMALVTEAITYGQLKVVDYLINTSGGLQHLIYYQHIALAIKHDHRTVLSYLISANPDILKLVS
eukprot:gene12403-14555_t